MLLSAIRKKILIKNWRYGFVTAVDKQDENANNNKIREKILRTIFLKMRGISSGLV